MKWHPNRSVLAETIQHIILEKLFNRGVACHEIAGEDFDICVWNACDSVVILGLPRSTFAGTFDDFDVAPDCLGCGVARSNRKTEIKKVVEISDPKLYDVIDEWCDYMAELQIKRTED